MEYGIKSGTNNMANKSMDYAKKKISTKLILLLPVFILGIVCIMSSVVAIANIQGVNAKATVITDKYMMGISELAKIQEETNNIHKKALSHVLATDLESMISLVDSIKEQEGVLDCRLCERNAGRH